MPFPHSLIGNGHSHLTDTIRLLQSHGFFTPPMRLFAIRGSVSDIECVGINGNVLSEKEHYLVIRELQLAHTIEHTVQQTNME